MSGVAFLGEVAGSVPVVLVAPLFAFAFLARFMGVSHAQGEGHATMPWFPRAASWVLFGLGVAFAANALSIGVLLAFVALDAAGGFVKRYAKGREAPPRPRGSRRRLWWTLALVGYLGLVAAFHLLVGLYLPFGALVTWTLLALGFCVALRIAIAGPKAGEAWLRAPHDHRIHERKEEKVQDPVRAKAEDVLAHLRARGDAGPFLDFVRDAARAADLSPDEMQGLEARILASFARAGTGRDEDVNAALEEVERHLSLRGSRSPSVR